jgi:hypothetical protein
LDFQFVIYTDEHWFCRALTILSELPTTNY